MVQNGIAVLKVAWQQQPKHSMMRSLVKPREVRQAEILGALIWSAVAAVEDAVMPLSEVMHSNVLAKGNMAMQQMTECG